MDSAIPSLYKARSQPRQGGEEGTWELAWPSCAKWLVGVAWCQGQNRDQTCSPMLPPGLEHTLLFTQACVRRSLPARPPATSYTSKVLCRAQELTGCSCFTGSSTSHFLRKSFWEQSCYSARLESSSGPAAFQAVWSTLVSALSHLPHLRARAGVSPSVSQMGRQRPPTGSWPMGLMASIHPLFWLHS